MQLVHSPQLVRNPQLVRSSKWQLVRSPQFLFALLTEPNRKSSLTGDFLSRLEIRP